jgi:hypothetical protein
MLNERRIVRGFRCMTCYRNVGAAHSQCDECMSISARTRAEDLCGLGSAPQSGLRAEDKGRAYYYTEDALYWMRRGDTRLAIEALEKASEILR